MCITTFINRRKYTKDENIEKAVWRFEILFFTSSIIISDGLRPSTSGGMSEPRLEVGPLPGPNDDFLSAGLSTDTSSFGGAKVGFA